MKACLGQRHIHKYGFESWLPSHDFKIINHKKLRTNNTQDEAIIATNV